MADLFSSAGFSIELVQASTLKVGDCKGCFACWVKRPGDCVFKDDSQAVTRSLVQADVLTLLTPISFGGYSSQLKHVMDRIISNALPHVGKYGVDTHHVPRYSRYPALLGIGMAESHDPDSADVFTRLIHRNALNIHSPACAACVISRHEGLQAVKNSISHAMSKAGVILG